MRLVLDQENLQVKQVPAKHIDTNLTCYVDRLVVHTHTFLSLYFFILCKALRKCRLNAILCSFGSMYFNLYLNFSICAGCLFRTSQLLLTEMHIRD